MLPDFDITFLFLFKTAVFTLLGISILSLIAMLVLRKWPRPISAALRPLFPDFFSVESTSETIEEAQQGTVRMKSDWLDNVNHELRTPLAGIMATAQMLHEEVSPEQRKLTEMLVHSSKRMDTALGNVLKLVELQNHSTEINEEPIHLATTVSALLGGYQKRAALKGIGLDLLPFDANLTVKTDPIILSTVLEHLLDNAIKFTESGGVQLSVKDENRWLHVQIKDTGIGIQDSFMPHLGEAFIQQSQGLTRAFNGQGLGLALTRQMLDRVGGQFAVESAVGKGSTFTVSLPK